MEGKKMNKKLFVLTAIMTMAYGFVNAEMYNVPSANTSQPADVNYGGVKVSTSSFTAGYSSVAFSAGIVYGANFSVGSTTDYIEVWDSSSVATAVGYSYRIYNLANSTNGSTSGTLATGFTSTGYPRRHKAGIIAKPSSRTFLSLDLLYWKPD